MNRMFPFVTHTCNPLGGGPCPFSCSYCWATNLKNRYKYKKYQGPWRIYEKELKTYKHGDFPFPFDMIDIGSPNIPDEIIITLMAWIAKQPCEMLLLTKNPAFYRENQDIMPHNAWLGATIETDNNITLKFSKAPEPWRRLTEMQYVADNMPANKTFVSIEPIMGFSPDFERELMKIRPHAVAVGYDNYNNQLPEPNLAATEALIKELETFTTVYRKTIRESRLSQQLRSSPDPGKPADELEIAKSGNTRGMKE